MNTNEVRVKLLPASEGDFEAYFAIKSSDSDIFWMGYDGPPDKENLRTCFMGRLGSCPFEKPGNKRIYMIDAEGQKAGYIQFTFGENDVESGISVLDSFRGQGIGTKAMGQAAILLKAMDRPVLVHIRDDNFASQRIHIKAGFVPTEDVVPRFYPQTGWVPYRRYDLKR